jgi:hypothetical protein
MAEARIKDVTLTAVDATAATTAAALNIGPGWLDRVVLYRASGSPAEFAVRFYADAAKTKLVATANWTASTDPVLPGNGEFAARSYDNVYFDALYATAATDASTLTGNLQIFWRHDPTVQRHPDAITISG